MTRLVSAGGVVALLLAVAVGCGGPPAGVPAKPGVADSLRDLGDLLKLLAEQKQKPPAKAADLTQYEPTAPYAVAAVQAKQIVYLWGGGYATGGGEVVAYEADADTKGGQVLLQDGTVKAMTADEFKAAPKPKGGGKK